ncbi:hypothetical protein BN130_2605 [Cronobacter malonaticus 507]|nr:hypothetical protein BN130_2605 [Cronobacter malonaticus 507]
MEYCSAARLFEVYLFWRKKCSMGICNKTFQFIYALFFI